jgi:predicted extracellular nuclease
MRTGIGALLTAFFCAAGTTRADVRITEWMYNPAGATNWEYFELTNLGAAAVDMTGWSFDDGAPPGVPGAFSLSGFDVVAPGESVIVTEGTAALFRTEWSLSAAVKVLGGNNQNLSRDDGINVFDNANMLVDRLTYNDQGTGNVDGPRTQGISGNPLTLAVLGTNNASQWVLASVGDKYGSLASVSNDIGSPGRFSIVPEPAAVSLASAGLLIVGMRRRRN